MCPMLIRSLLEIIENYDNHLEVKTELKMQNGRQCQHMYYYNKTNNRESNILS